MKIPKKLLRRARRELEPLQASPDPQWERWLTVAAVLALAELRDTFEWIQPPPANTALAWVQQSVMLGFRPQEPLHLGPDPDDEAAEQARKTLSPLDEPQQESLRCLGLKTLEGNLSWRSVPAFTHLEQGDAP